MNSKNQMTPKQEKQFGCFVTWLVLFCACVLTGIIVSAIMCFLHH